jgi:GT2 family glycosyltransferase
MSAGTAAAGAPSQPAAAASVTVIIVNWNSGALLKKCLDALELQTLKPHRILVVDNASRDDSLRSAAGRERVEVLPQAANLGFAAGNNLALRHCDTAFVALLNPDAFPEPKWLQSLLEAAAAHPAAAAFGSRQLTAEDPALLDGIGDRYHASGLVWRDRHGVLQTAGDLVPREIFAPCAAAALYRRPAVVAAGGFDEDFFCYVEDVDLGFRLRLAGHGARYVPAAVVHHVGSGTTGGQQGDFPVYHGHRNLVWTFVKNMPGPLFWLLLPLHLLLNVTTILWFALRGRGRIILASKRDALLGLPRAWAKRRMIQAQRTVGIGAIWKALDRRLWPTRNL